MTVFNEKYAEIILDVPLNAVVLRWKDFAAPEQYQKAVETAYETALENNCPNWVSDMTGGKAVSISSINWLKNICIPKMAKDGVIRKIAFLIDYNPARKIFADEIKETILMNGISFKSFKIRADMENWIRGPQTEEPENDRTKAFSQFF